MNEDRSEIGFLSGVPDAPTEHLEQRGSAFFEHDFHKIRKMITIGGGGIIEYIYTARGTLLQKIVNYGNSNIDTFVYWGPFVYKTKALQYILRQEGMSGNSHYIYQFLSSPGNSNFAPIKWGSGPKYIK